MHLTLRQAEQHVHASKSTILRAIRTGKLSADRDGPEGAYRIEPSELFRVFPPVSDQPAAEADNENVSKGDARQPDLIAMARMAADLEKLEALLEAERRRGEELRTERDAWKGQAERLALVHHVPPAPEHPQGALQTEAGRPNLLERLGRALRG